MNRSSLSHIGIVLFLIVCALALWGARLMFLQADVDVLKPASVSHQNNIADPATGNAEAHAAFDFSERNDHSTYAVIYLPDEDPSDVFFYNFTGDTEDIASYRLGMNYEFEENKGDDGFTISYSFEGNSSCSDESSRIWTELDEVTYERGKLSKTAILPEIDPSELCVRISRSVKNDLDVAGFEFRNSNSLKIYDIWLDVAEPEIELYVETLSKTFAPGETFEYRLKVDNAGGAVAEDVTVYFPLPDQVTYERSSQTYGTYSPISSEWVIGDLPAETMVELLIIVNMDNGFVGERVQSAAIISFIDSISGDEQKFATSLRYDVVEEPAGIPVTPLGEGLTRMSLEELQVVEEESEIVVPVGDQPEEILINPLEGAIEVDGVFYNEEGIIVGVSDELLIFDDQGNYFGPEDQFTTYTEDGMPVFFVDPRLGVVPESVEEDPEVIEDVPILESVEDDSLSYCTDCERATFYLYLVNPDGSIRNTRSEFAEVEYLSDRHFNVWFEDKGGDFDYDDIGFELDLRDCRNIRVKMHTLNAGWHHQVKANIYYDGILQEAVTLWEDSHEGIGQTVVYDAEDYIQDFYRICENG